MKIIYFCGLIIISIWFFMFYLRKFYILLDIKKIYMPSFLHSKDEFINNEPLKILKTQRNKIYLTFVLWFIVLIIFFYKTPAFYINIILFILAFIFSKLTFKYDIKKDMNIFNMFSKYLN